MLPTFLSRKCYPLCSVWHTLDQLEVCYHTKHYVWLRHSHLEGMVAFPPLKLLQYHRKIPKIWIKKLQESIGESCHKWSKTKRYKPVCIFTGPIGSRGPFYQHGLTLIPAWIIYHMPVKFGIQLRIHSQTSTVTQLKFGNGLVISSHTI